MSTSVDAHAFVGFQVSHNELWDLMQDDHETCPKGHVKEGKGAFCGDCGGRYIRRQREVPTKGLQRLVDTLSIDPEDVTEAGLRDYGIGVSIAQVASCNYDPQVLGVAVQVAEVRGYSQYVTPEAMSKDKILQAFESLEHYRKLLLDDPSREIQVYIQLYYC